MKKRNILFFIFTLFLVTNSLSAQNLDLKHYSSTKNGDYVNDFSSMAAAI